MKTYFVCRHCCGDCRCTCFRRRPRRMARELHRWVPRQQGGTYFAYGSGWANLVAEELGITGGGEVTGGPMQNMALVHTGDAQFGMTTMGPAAESLQGTNPIAPGLQMTNACAMFPMYQTPFAVTTLDVLGHRLDRGHPGRGENRVWSRWFHV